MTTVGIKIDSRSVLNQLHELGQDRQGAFVLSRSLNLLARKVQDDLRHMEEDRLTLRRRTWVLNQTKIDKESWSTKTRLVVTIALTPAADFLGRMEDGTTKHPRHNGYLMIPTWVMGKGVIDRSNPLAIKNLNLRQTAHGIQGDKRTFMLKTTKGEPLILQRVGDDAKGRAAHGKNLSSGLRVLYMGKKSVPIPKKLQWYETAQHTVQTEQYNVFKGVLEAALKAKR